MPARRWCRCRSLGLLACSHRRDRALIADRGSGRHLRMSSEGGRAAQRTTMPPVMRRANQRWWVRHSAWYAKARVKVGIKHRGCHIWRIPGTQESLSAASWEIWEGLVVKDPNAEGTGGQLSVRELLCSGSVHRCRISDNPAYFYSFLLSLKKNSESQREKTSKPAFRQHSKKCRRLFPSGVKLMAGETELHMLRASLLWKSSRYIISDVECALQL